MADSKTWEEKIGQAAQTLMQLKKNVEDLEAQLKEAKAEYEGFRTDDLPLLLRSAGMSAVITSTGLKVELVREITCSPNKNDKDQQTLMRFLKAKGGAMLIKEALEVIPDAKTLEVLDNAGIPYNVKESVNTNSLKSWLKSQLGYDGISVACMEETEIPPCVHFYAPTVAKITQA